MRGFGLLTLGMGIALPFSKPWQAKEMGVNKGEDSGLEIESEKLWCSEGPACVL